MTNQQKDNQEEDYENQLKKRIDEIYELEEIANLDLKQVCADFEIPESLDKLKENEIFKNIFEYIWIEVDPLNRDFDIETIPKIVRDIFLITKWHDYLKRQGFKDADKYLNTITAFLIDLYMYRGVTIHDELDYEAMQEIIEMRIIKSRINPPIILLIAKVLENFFEFLEKNDIKNDVSLSDKEDINNLIRVSKEFKEGVWEKNNTSYQDWREKNITYYF